MEFEKGGIWVLFRGCMGYNAHKACRDGRGYNASNGRTPAGTVSDRRDDSGSTYSTNSTYS